jgi:transposase
MSYEVKQKIKGTVYVYEATSHWDKQKKKTYQTRDILGKIDKVTGKFSPSLKSKVQVPLFSKSYGNSHLLNSISNQIGLTDILKTSFPENYLEILTCAFYEVSEKKPLYLCQSWCEKNHVLNNICLSSQRISELLSNMDDSDRMCFFKKWCNYRTEREYLAFDITSISSYSELISFVEAGYNRDKEKLPQINLAMLFGQTSQLPVFYNFYPGSIHDVSTLPNMIVFAKELGLENMKFVMDKGFYSQQNVDDLLDNHLRFTIAIPFNNNFSKKYVDNVSETINNCENSIVINNDILYAQTTSIKIKNKKVYVHTFFNEQHYIDEKEKLYRKIAIFEEEIKNNPNTDITGFSKYLNIKRTAKNLKSSRNKKKIENDLKYKGYLVLLSNDIADPKEAAYVYRIKDRIEKAFDNLKNDLDLKRLRIHSNNAMRGRLFIAFIALILTSHIHKTMKSADLSKKYTVEELISELEKISLIEFESGIKLMTEITKKQRLIYEKFNVALPTI